MSTVESDILIKFDKKFLADLNVVKLPNWYWQVSE